MPAPELAELKIAPYQAAPAQLITARSYFIDRIVPDCEIVALPAKTVAGGVLRFGQAPVVARALGRGGRLGGVLGTRRGRRQVSDRCVFDFRLHHPQNWAHFLTNHLPIFFRICQGLDLDWADTLIVTPANTPKYIHAAAGFFGLELMASDDDITGDGVVFEATPWVGIRAARTTWVRQPKITDVVTDATSDSPPVGRRLFLSRRDTRTLSNEAEVAAYLAARGFVTVYPETLPVADQFRLFREAETIVAIHGAGLAPLLYIPPGGRLRQLVEILPCGHMTDVFRVMAQQVGVAWIGVRGRLKPAYVRPAYDFDTDFRAFSLDSFTVDISSLARAFELAEHPIKEGYDG